MGGRGRGALLVFVLLASVSGSLALRAWLRAPKGTVFVGTFYYVDDFYNYLGYVEQAGRGQLVLRNKLADPALPPSLVNLEWLTVGWLSALLGGRPLLAYRIFGLAALAGLVAGIDRCLARCGLPANRRLAGLLLVATGGGLGGLLLVLGRLPGERALDLRTGAFPFIESLANPHFLAGTALLLAALLAFAAGRAGLGVALGTVLGLVRPYDAALLAVVEPVAVLLTAPAGQWPRRLAPVAGLVPVLAYDAWLFLAGPGYSAFSSLGYAAEAPHAVELALGVGPAVLLALAAARLPGEPGREHRVRLALWAAVALLTAWAQPVAFATQFLVGAGTPLLCLAAVGLARRRRFVLELAVPLMASTAAVATWLLTLPGPSWHVPEGRWRAAAALRGICRPGDVVLSPPDIGLYVGGLTPCWPWVSHSAAPEYPERAEAVRRFYGATPAERVALLDRACIEHVVVPASTSDDWLPVGAPFRAGPGADGVVVWSREGASPCPSRR